MLEEYICLGGNEVANNARTYGYATTAGCPVTWFRCEPCESIHDVTTDWVAPTFRLFELRRNLFTDPSADTGGTGAWSSSGVTQSKPSGSAFSTAFATRFTASAADTSMGMRTLLAPVPSMTYSIRFSARASSTQTFSVRYRPVSPTSTTGEVVLPSVTITTDVQDFTATFDTTATATTATSGIVLLASSATVGQWVEITKVLVERADFPGPFFDGDFADDPPSYYEWAGATDASESILLNEVVEFQGHSTDPPYTLDYIQNAPWYDAQYPDLTGRFYGVFILAIENMNSSTRTASVTEGILNGGVVGLVRHGTREMRVRALLVADGEDALEYGMAWLNAALAADGCSTHGASCGAVDMNFFAACPETPDPNTTVVVETPESRHMHNVTVISGPLVEQKIESNNETHFGYIIEWTMVAGTPWVFSETKEVSVNLQPPVVVQDVPYNLIPYPSAELSNGTVTLATNYSTNPSVETDATLWVAEVTTITPAPTGARSTEIAAQGTASYKVSVTTTNTGVSGTIRASQVVTLPAEVTGQRFSINMWGFMAVVSGTAALGQLRLVAEWRNASNTVLRTDDIGTAPATGGAISGLSLTRPAGATNVRVYMIGDVTSWSTGAVLNLFADALAVTIP